MPRSNAEWNALALEAIVPALQAGASMATICAQYGASTVTIRKALSRVGYDTKGQPVTITSNGNHVLAKRIAARRDAGDAWWHLTED